MVKDPVCGMQIDEKSAVGKTYYKGKTCYFCSSHCLDTFNKEPDKYIQNGEDSGHYHHDQ
ncbi:MAG: YHS domain-containing protein [Promethearchaeota archaeon]